MNNKLHCCERMNFFLEENSVDIFYYPNYRRYCLGMKNGTSAVQAIYFCPWCGQKTPEILYDIYFDIIEKITNKNYYDIDLDSFIKTNPEFQTDEWWKKRGL